MAKALLSGLGFPALTQMNIKIQQPMTSSLLILKMALQRLRIKSFFKHLVPLYLTAY
ncbi:MAG: hypothetical protein Q4F97_09405 [Bacteroidales bacterium]|nr:hypothetical protein [Bacteroidales bacterium]